MKIAAGTHFLALVLLFSTSLLAVENSKSLVLSLNFTEGKMFFENADFLYRTPPNTIREGDFEVKVISREGVASYETFFKDPRKSFAETFYENGSIEGFERFKENAQFNVVLGIDDDSSAVKIMDENQTTLLTIYLNELQTAKAFFCQIPNKVCDPVFCGETDVDCQEGKEEALAQEKQEERLEESQGAQGKVEEKDGTEPSKDAQVQAQKDNYDSAVQVVYALILLLLAYVGASVVLKHAQKKQ